MVWYGGMFISCHEDFSLLGRRRLVADEFNEPQHYGTMVWYGTRPYDRRMQEKCLSRSKCGAYDIHSKIKGETTPDAAIPW